MKIFKGTFSEVEDDFNKWQRETNFKVTMVSSVLLSETEIMVAVFYNF